MSKKKIRIISIAMGLAVVGVIVIQIYWISNAYGTLRQRLFREVNNRIENVVEKHEVLLTIELIEEIDSRGFSGISSLETQENEFSKVDSSQVVFRKSSVAIEEVTFEPNLEKILRLQAGDGKMGIPDSVTTQETQEFGETRRDSQVVDFQKLKSNSESHLFRLLRSFLTDYPNINKIKIEKELDSLVNIEMAGFNPRLNFQYEILDEPADTFDHFVSTGDHHNIFRKKLFPSSTTPHNLHILVNIIDPVKAVLSEMKLVLVASVVFMFIIIYSFVFTINSLVRQGKLSQMKSDFINNMTHELKTPITTISLATEALLDRNVEVAPEKVHNMSRLISKENDRLKSQVERVLQMERLDRNKIKLDQQEVSLNAFLEEILQNVSIQVESKQGTITWSLKAENDMVLIDELHIGNVIYNLIDNAIKYSVGRIEIFVNAYSYGDSIFVDIEDKGMGIPKDLQPRIFERFYRVPTGNLHDVKGFGLGLSYVKEMMNLHNGDVRVSSRVGKGSTFTLIFPTIKNSSTNDKL